MITNDRSVREAIRSALSPGDELCTPTGSPFEIKALDDVGLKVNKPTQRIKWAVLDGVPAYMARFDAGEVAIGSKKGPANEGTLERFLQDGHCDQTMRASFVAPILAEAQVCEILPKQGRDGQRIRLKSGWWPSAQ